ncbi:MAG: cytochrome c [Acidobacteria bacterium]|nr:cytochrome c [Acidobacteriota bacterium]MBI3265368.1 cytochrome c [Acidobacteriota bacterium]
MRVAVVSIVCLVGLALAAPAWAQDPNLIEQGAKLFTDQKCTLCHSVAGKGNPKGVLDAVGAKLSANEIREWIVSPKEMTAKTKAERKPPMKAYPNLSKTDVDALVAYVSSLKKK